MQVLSVKMTKKLCIFCIIHPKDKKAIPYRKNPVNLTTQPPNPVSS